MLTLLLAALLLTGVGLALGRAPLYRLLVSGVALSAYGASALVWAGLIVGVPGARGLVDRLPGAAGGMVLLVPPLLLTLLLLRGLRRSGRPRFLARLRERPATLSLPGIVAVQGAVLVVLVVGGNAAAALREREAQQAWRAAGQPLEDIPFLYPKVETNAAGRELERLAAALGIVAVRGEEARPRVGPSAYSRVEGRLSAYLSEASRAEGPPAAPPVEVRTWLTMTAGRRAALRRHLLTAGPLVWEADIDAWRAPPLGHLRDVHAALLAGAYEAGRAGRPQEARAELEAAWRLTASLRERPHTYARLIALVHDRRVLTTLRALGAVGDEWEPRLQVMARPQLGDALAVEARSVLEDARGLRTTARGLHLEASGSIAAVWGQRRSRLATALLRLSGGDVDLQGALQAVEAERARARRPFYRFVQGPLEKPWLRLSAADFVAAAAAERAAASVRGGCPPEARAEGAAPRLPFWNLMGEDALPDDLLFNGEAARRAELELTRHVLRARALRAAAGEGAWPAALPGLESTACPSWRWRYETGADGRALVRLEGHSFGEREAALAYRLGP